jgi:hypothetical protein
MFHNASVADSDPVSVLEKKYKIFLIKNCCVLLLKPQGRICKFQGKPPALERERLILTN